MPELPEVQTVVNDLNKKIVRKRILDVWYNWPRTVKHPDAKTLKKLIKGAKILEVKRRAKNILIFLDGNRVLLIHLKMTGHLLIGKWRVSKGKALPLLKGRLQEKVNSYIHFIFYLDDGSMLGFSDVRKFGKILFGPAHAILNSNDFKKIGPEPLDPKLTYKKFHNIFTKQKRKIKQVLMDPNVIAGIGNIYSDDILWLSKIHPLRPANSLNRAELASIYKSIRLVLKRALKLRGTSISDFRDTSGEEGYYGSERLVYQRKGEPCKHCGSIIKKIIVGARSSSFCPNCQI